MPHIRKEYLMVSMLGVVLALAILDSSVPIFASTLGEQYYTVVVTKTIATTVTEVRTHVLTTTTTITSPITRTEAVTRTYVYTVTMPTTVLSTSLVPVPSEVVPIWAWATIAFLSIVIAVLVALLVKKGKAG